MENEKKEDEMVVSIASTVTLELSLTDLVMLRNMSGAAAAYFNGLAEQMQEAKEPEHRDLFIGKMYLSAEFGERLKKILEKIPRHPVGSMEETLFNAEDEMVIGSNISYETLQEARERDKVFEEEQMAEAEGTANGVADPEKIIFFHKG